MTGQGELFQLADATAADPDGTAGSVPGWLSRILEEAADWRRSAHAKLHPCPKCGHLVLFAADMALDLMTESTVDPAVLDRGGEVACLLAGRFTAELEVMRHGGGPLIYRRDRWLVAREPNARRRLWVPEHVCNSAVGVELPLEMIYPFESKMEKPRDNECPF